VTDSKFFFLQGQLKLKKFKEFIERQSHLKGRGAVKSRQLVLQQKFAWLMQQQEQFRRTHVEALRQADHLFQTLLHRAFSPS
jgi:hypothetical protein